MNHVWTYHQNLKTTKIKKNLPLDLLTQESTTNFPYNTITSYTQRCIEKIIDKQQITHKMLFEKLHIYTQYKMFKDPPSFFLFNLFLFEKIFACVSSISSCVWHNTWVSICMHHRKGDYPSYRAKIVKKKLC